MSRFILAVLSVAVGVLGPVVCTGEEMEGTISMSGAWALYPMAVRWGEEYQKLHPKIQFDISAGGAGKGMTDALAGAVDIGLVSRDVSPAEIQKGGLPIAVTKDAVVPMMNANNPMAAELRKKGVKHEVFEGIWIKEEIKTWGQVAGTEDKTPVRVFTRSDACGAAETWAKYLGGKKQEDLKGIGVYGDPGLGEAVRRDPLAIGFNNVNYAYDAKTGKPVAGLDPIPIDVNGNGVVDSDENCYATQDDLVKAIADGRYPSPPARNLFFVTKGKPAKPELQAFIKWVLTDGQKYVSETGYIQIPQDRLDEGLKAVE